MVWWVLGCAASSFQDITQEPGDIGTVVTVSWWSPVKAEGRVALKTDAGVRFLPATRQSDQGGFFYTAEVLGLTSDATLQATLQLHDDESVLDTSSVQIEAGRLDMVLPPLSLTEATASPEGYLLTSFSRDPAAVVILNEQGEKVWAVEGREGAVISAARLHPDGGRILYGEFGYKDYDGSAGEHQMVWISLDGREEVRHPAPGLHHDFTILPDGTVAFISYDPVEIDGELILGDRIVEMTEDGQTVEIWSAWDVLPYLAETPSNASGWTHANALNYDPDEAAYYLSLHNYNAILKIDRASGETLWTLGGPDSNFAFEESITFRRQHNFQLLPGGRILLFDNGSMTEGITEVHELQLNLDTNTVDGVWNYQPDPSLYTLVLGDVQRLSNKNTLVTFSGSGIIEEVSPDGEALWRMETPLGSVLGYSEAVETPAGFFTPADER